MLQLTPDDVLRDAVFVLEIDGLAAGWHRIRANGGRAELEDLWLEPGWIGKGHGRYLFEHAAGVARSMNAGQLEWDAEPYALAFYQAMGAVVIGEVPSAAETGRMLPRMRLRL